MSKAEVLRVLRGHMNDIKVFRLSNTNKIPQLLLALMFHCRCHGHMPMECAVPISSHQSTLEAHIWSFLVYK